MNYENARDLLPKELLKEVQKYAGGKMLYIPVESENKGWGEVSGYRQQLLKRNITIYNRYKNGTTLSELAEEWIRMYYEFIGQSHSNEPAELIVTGVLKIPLRLIDSEAIQDGDTLGFSDELAEPLIVYYREKHFYVHYQKALLATLKKKKVNAHPAFIIIQNKEEYRIFMSNFGRHFIDVKFDPFREHME